MARIALVFPGQGAQFVGMGHALASEFDAAERVFSRADNALNESLSELCWQGPEDKLRLTENAQPAILATSIAYLEVLRQYGVSASVAAGLSLGEYSALVAAGSIKFEDALRLVRVRGRIMQQAVPDGVGAMVAVVGLSAELVDTVCQQARSFGVVQPANYNCPGQVVISGERAAVEEAARIALGSGAKKAIPLAVSAPFHSSLMEPAALKMQAVLDTVCIQHAEIPVIANATALAVSTPEEIRSALIHQMANPVLWEQSVRRLLAEGIDTFIEVGPGKTLTGFLKKISPGVACLKFDDRESLETIIESGKVGC